MIREEGPGFGPDPDHLDAVASDQDGGHAEHGYLGVDLSCTCTRHQAAVTEEAVRMWHELFFSRREALEMLDGH